MRSALCICAAVLFSALNAYSQTPISETCAKASMTAVQEILKDWKSTTAKSSYANMKTKCKNNTGEGSAMILVDTVRIAKENNRPMPASCTEPIETAFRRNTVLDDPPESCVTGDKN